MSHNLHYIVVDADSPEEAMSVAESEIENWGNENNWRTMVAAIDKDGNVTLNKNEDSRYLDRDFALDKINADFDRLLSRPSFGWGLSDEQYKELAALMTKIVETNFEPEKLQPLLIENHRLLYYLKGMGETLYRMSETLSLMKADSRDHFDIFRDEYRTWELDEYGVTHLGSQYVVAFDMHS